VADRDVVLIRRVLAQGWRYRWMILLSLLASAVTGAFSGFLFSKLGPFLKFMGHAGTSSDRSELIAATAGLTALGFLLIKLAPAAGAASYLSWWSGQWVANRSMRDLRDRVLGHLVRLDLSFHAELRRGDLLARLTTDLGGVLIVQQQLYGKILQRPLESLGILCIVGYMDLRLLAGILVVLAVAAMILIPLVRRTRSRSQRARETLVTNFGVLEQITAGIRVIKAMGSTQREQSRYAGHNRDLFRDNMRLVRTRAQSDAISNIAVWAIAGGGMMAGGWLFEEKLITPDLLFLAIGALARLITSLREVVRTMGDIQECLPSVARVNALLDRTSAVVDAPAALPCPPPRDAIRLEGVSFRYQQNDQDVLRDISMTIPIGKTVALVGRTGAGKTTLLDLLPRFHDVTNGRITIDGTDLRAVTLDSLAQYFAIVQQDNFLFDDTILQNISYGRPGATRAEVEIAARRADVHDDILALEGGQGYDTEVGDRGGRLSGGQRQRIAIARALLRDAPILLLDEATSSLDAESEGNVQHALGELMRGRTVVVIAHRLATVQHADLICVLAGKDHPRRGTIIESGTHQDLVALGGEYAELVRLQQLRS
jgi:subfamily B ATP-binding cassette protein MsbA